MMSCLSAPGRLKPVGSRSSSNTRLPRHVRSGGAAPACAVPPCRASARDFVEDLSSLPGEVRFIVVGEGAILETVASMSPVKYTDVKAKGTLATIRWAMKDGWVGVLDDEGVHGASLHWATGGHSMGKAGALKSAWWCCPPPPL